MRFSPNRRTGLSTRIILRMISIFAVLVWSVSCSSSSSISEDAIVLPERLRLRSSTAQASRSVGEIKSGDLVTITGKATSEEGDPWVKIIGPDGLTGWAEERYFVAKAIVDKSRQIADEISSIQTQAVGRSKATLRLRLSPSRETNENVATLLPSGTIMEIVGRQRVPRPVDDTQKSSSETSGETAATEVRYDDWYQIRLVDYAVLPAGWIYGGSVELEIPPDIFYYSSAGRRITGWQKIGTTHGEDGRSGNNYLVLERRTFGVNEKVDFDRIKILAYEPISRNYITPYRENVSGVFPVTLKMEGTRGKFQITVIEEDDSRKVINYSLETLDGGRVQVRKIDPNSE